MELVYPGLVLSGDFDAVRATTSPDSLRVLRQVCSEAVRLDPEDAALLSYGATLDRFDNDTMAALNTQFWDVQPLSGVVVVVVVTGTRRIVVILVRRVLRAGPGNGFDCWYVVMQGVVRDTVSGGSCYINGAPHFALVDEDRA